MADYEPAGPSDARPPPLLSVHTGIQPTLPMCIYHAHAHQYAKFTRNHAHTQTHAGETRDGSDSLLFRGWRTFSLSGSRLQRETPGYVYVNETKQRTDYGEKWRDTRHDHRRIGERLMRLRLAGDAT